MGEVTIPTGPALVTIPGVELAQAGTWRLSSGETVITREDLAAAVGAQDCPAVRNPVLKLGHTDARFDGQPAVGWISGMGVTDDGETVTGDYRGVPAWLGKVMASAYPDRSIEATRKFRCQIGHTHPMVITAVALLGVTAPGIGTLASLQDVAELYEVAASADGGGEPLTITITGGGRMPTPEPDRSGPVALAAGVTTEDVRRQYYDTNGYEQWIAEIHLDPELQLICVDDQSGSYSRVPVSTNGDKITFGDPIPVAVKYVDKPAAKVAASSLIFASRTESIPDGMNLEPADDLDIGAAEIVDETGDNEPGHEATKTPDAVPASGPTEEMEVTDMEFSDEQKAALRTALGLPADADLDSTQVVDGIAKLAASGGEGSPGKTKTTNMPGTITVDRQVWDDMHTRINRLEEVRASQARNERDRVIEAAIKDGKFAPNRRELWTRQWDADPESTREVLASLPIGSVPVSDYGMPGGADTGYIDSEFSSLFPPVGGS